MDLPRKLARPDPGPGVPPGRRTELESPGRRTLMSGSQALGSYTPGIASCAEAVTQESILDVVMELSRRQGRRALESITTKAFVRSVEHELGAARGSLRAQARFIRTVMDGCKLVVPEPRCDVWTAADSPRTASPVGGYGSDEPTMSDDEGSVELSVYQDSDSEVESTDRDQAKSGEADVADTVCLACKDGRYSETNHILLCDGCFENGEPCPSALHQACLRPFQSVPLGDWLCPDCVSDVAAGLWRGGDNSGARRESRTGPCFQASLPELLRTPATSSASSSSPWTRRSCRSSGGRPAPVSVSTSTF